MSAVGDSKTSGAAPHTNSPAPELDGESPEAENESPKPENASIKSKVAGKRRFSRYDWQTHVQVLWLDEHARGASLTMRTADLSAGGIGLLSSSWVHMDRCGAVLLTDRPGHRFIRWVQVIHGRYVPKQKTHVIGCKWISTPENAPTVRIIETSSGPHLTFE